MLDSYLVNPSIAMQKQNCFTKLWYNINPFIEYSQNLEEVFCFKCLLFRSKIGCSEDIRQNEALNQYDKMKTRGKQKKKKKRRKDRNTFYLQLSQAKYSKISFAF